MHLEPFPFRHVNSTLNPALIESWCPGCGVFIAASVDIKKLQTAENTHACPGKPANGYSRIKKK
jgi:pyruvate/2-oxoacid:ferredoxin oxidoreductase beta subunit